MSTMADAADAARYQAERIKRPTRWLTPANCAAAEPRGYIVKGLLAPGDLMLIFGGPGVGKSGLAPRLAYAIAQGTEIFGRRVRQGRALYIACEDPHGMCQRIAALRVAFGDTPDLLLPDGPFDFMTPESHHKAELKARIADFGACVVIIDTIAAGWPGLKENESGSDGMGAVVAFARELTALRGVAVVLLHHVPKNDASTPRGHGLLHGDADVTLGLSRQNDGTIRAAMTKNRNGPSDGIITFEIRPVTLGTDEDGDPITAPVACPVEGGRTKGPKLSKAVNTAARWLADLICGEGKALPSEPGFPSVPLSGVQEDRWRRECDDRRLSTAEKSDDRARAFRAAYRKLREAGVVAACNGWVWLTDPEQAPNHKQCSAGASEGERINGAPIGCAPIRSAFPPGLPGGARRIAPG